MVPLPAAWRRVLTWMRLAFAGGGLAGGLLLSPRSTPWAVATAGVYLLFSLVVPLRRRSGRAFALLELFVDLVYFLVLVGAGIGSIVWLPAFYFLYMLAEAVFVYGAAEVLIVVLVSAIFCIAVQSENVFPIRRTAVVMGALAYAFAVYKKRLEARMQELECEDGETREEAQRAREAERQRIASDFHDGPLQSFISLQMRLEILRKLLTRDLNAGMEDLRQLQILAQQQIRDLRAFLHSMRPVDVDGASMVATARRAAETFQKETGIPVTFIGTNTPVGLPPGAALGVLQIIREALQNVQKHAGATRVAVAMEKSDRGLEISIDDNGHGFNFAGAYSLEELELLHLGPESLKRRARSLNSDMLLESRPGRGASIKVRIPPQ